MANDNEMDINRIDDLFERISALIEQARGYVVLSARLTDRFGNDWSYDTLVRCRKFYTAYLNAQIVATPLPQFSRRF